MRERATTEGRTDREEEEEEDGTMEGIEWNLVTLFASGRRGFKAW